MAEVEQDTFEEQAELETENERSARGKPKTKRGKRAAKAGPAAQSGLSSIYYLHSLLLFTGRFLSKTLDFYNSLFEIGPRDRAKIYRNISTHYMKKGLEDKSLEYLQQWSKLEPANTEAHYQLGIALASTGKHKSALKTFERVLKLSSKHKGAKFRKSSLLLKLKDYPAAVTELESLVALVDNNAKVFYLLSIACDGLGETTRAIEAAEKAVAIDPDEIKYHQHLGFLNVRCEDHQKAAQSFSKVMELEREQDEDEY